MPAPSLHHRHSPSDHAGGFGFASQALRDVMELTVLRERPAPGAQHTSHLIEGTNPPLRPFHHPVSITSTAQSVTVLERTLTKSTNMGQVTPTEVSSHRETTKPPVLPRCAWAGLPSLHPRLPRGALWCLTPQLTMHTGCHVNLRVTPRTTTCSELAWRCFHGGLFGCFFVNSFSVLR